VAVSLEELDAGGKVSGLRRATEPAAICRIFACEADISKLKSSTAGLRFHDLRHHASRN